MWRLISNWVVIGYLGIWEGDCLRAHLVHRSHGALRVPLLAGQSVLVTYAVRVQEAALDANLGVSLGRVRDAGEDDASPGFVGEVDTFRYFPSTHREKRGAVFITPARFGHFQSVVELFERLAELFLARRFNHRVFTGAHAVPD